MKKLTMIIFALSLMGCAKTEFKNQLNETKCDVTVGYDGSKLSNYFAEQGLTLIETQYNEAELCKACDCKTGRVFIFD